MPLINKKRTTLTFSLAYLLLAACSQPPVVPLDDQSFVKPKKTVHIAGSGDTLYSIAFLAGLDYKELAAWNSIPDPYLIKRGQKITLVKPENYDKNVTNDVIRPVEAQTNQIEVKQPETEIVKPPQPEVEEPETRPQPEVANLKFVPFDNSWRWPIAALNIVNYKKSSQNNGLDIISHRGADVKATASGKVVYAGNGLKGYGNLIIIKHNETYLSAYAHNQSLNVKEGDQISQGQKIAEVGSSDANQAKLHFEIRKNGKPVSPLSLLPKKVG